MIYSVYIVKLEKPFKTILGQLVDTVLNMGGQIYFISFLYKFQIYLTDTGESIISKMIFKCL